MTLGYALCAYLLPLALACACLLLMREYGYATLLYRLAYLLMREADRATSRQWAKEQAMRRKYAEYQDAGAGAGD